MSTFDELTPEHQEKINKAVRSEKAPIKKFGMDKFETDARPDRRDDTGIETPDYIQELIDERASKRQSGSSEPSGES